MGSTRYQPGQQPLQPFSVHLTPATPPRLSPWRALGTVLRSAHRHRRPLAPLWAALAVLWAAAADRSGTALVLAVAALAMGAWWARGRRAAAAPARLRLSVRERALAASWLALAAGWAALAPVVAPDTAPVVSLACAVLTPSVLWALPVSSRMPRAARAAVRTWEREVAGAFGPAALRGSTVLPYTVELPSPATLVWSARLAHGQHAADAASEGTRRSVEALMGLGQNTVTLTTVRDDSRLLHVTLAAGRPLEAGPVGWEGPVLLEEGAIPVAVTEDGREVAIHLANEDGVEHLLIVGTSGVGKSTTTNVVATPGPCSGLETLWVIDGKQGTSAPQLRLFADWYVTRQQQWGAVIDAAHAVMEAREARRGEQGLDRFAFREEEDPILTLHIEEADKVRKVVGKKREQHVLEMLQRGRALGVRVVQVTHDPHADGLLGGRDAYALLAGAGSVIAHRPGDGASARKSLNVSADETLDLRALPPEPGFVAIARRGKILARVARVRFAPRDALKGVEVVARSLQGADLAAAGPEYARRDDVERAEAGIGTVTPAPVTEPAPAAPAPPTAPVTVIGEGAATVSAPTQTTVHLVPSAAAPAPEAEGELAVDRVARYLEEAGEPVARGAIATATGLADSTVGKALVALEAAGRAQRAPGRRWEMKEQVSAAA